jgi:hypothetical protein
VRSPWRSCLSTSPPAKLKGGGKLAVVVLVRGRGQRLVAYVVDPIRREGVLRRDIADSGGIPGLIFELFSGGVPPVIELPPPRPGGPVGTKVLRAVDKVWGAFQGLGH